MKNLVRTVAVAALLGGAPLMSACAQQKSPDYESRVNDSLKNAKLDDVKADWKKDEQALHLSGDVENAADKTRAEELAQQVVGTSGRVVNEVKIEGSNIDDVDNRIEKDLDHAFKEDNQWDTDGLDLSFHSKAGVVTVTGDSPSQAMKDRVTARVREIDGVKDVVNDLEVKPVKGDAGTAPRKPVHPTK